MSMALSLSLSNSLWQPVRARVYFIGAHLFAAVRASVRILRAPWSSSVMGIIIISTPVELQEMREFRLFGIGAVASATPASLPLCWLH